MNSITPFRKRRALVLGGLATVLACGVFATGAGAQEPLKIGFIGTLSGPAGALGQDQYDAFMLAIEQNQGKLGGVPVTVIRKDDQIKPDVGVQAAAKLNKSDKVTNTTGVTFSKVTMTIPQPTTDTGEFLYDSKEGPAPPAGQGRPKYIFSTH